MTVGSVSTRLHVETVGDSSYKYGEKTVNVIGDQGNSRLCRWLINLVHSAREKKVTYIS